MFGRTCYPIPFQIFIFSFFCLGCLETREGLELTEADSTVSSEIDPMCRQAKTVEEPLVESLEPKEALEKGILLTPRSYEAELACSIFSRPVSYRITEAKPGAFLLLPVHDLQYCVIVTRHSGYITLQHEEGNVTREGDHFMWCLNRHVSKEEERVGAFARLEVLSLTPEAEFTIALQRGIE